MMGSSALTGGGFTMDDRSDTFRLSEGARSVWAKSGSGGRSLPLPVHMLDAGEMGALLFDRWLAPAVKVEWGRGFPGGVDDARALFVFLAAAHDVGKASPAFVCQVEGLAERSRVAGLGCHTKDELRDDRRELPHGTVSHHALRRWLTSYGMSSTAAQQMASIVGAHHGRPIRGSRAVDRRPLGGGGREWAAVRAELLDFVEERFPILDRIETWSDLEIPLPTQVSMCGLVIMADWLASNPAYFPLAGAGESAPEGSRRYQAGWGAAAMPPPWDPEVPVEDVETLYRDRFSWDEDWLPRPLQRAVVDVLNRAPLGLLILEAEMGSGKTEAGLVAAEILAAQRGSHGVFVALPTQATTDAMFARVLPWIDDLPQPPADVPAWSMTLAHGKAALNKLYAEELEALDLFECNYVQQERVSGVHDDDGSGGDCCDDGGSEEPTTNTVAHQWFRGRKRRMLANFGVGTIDQILMAGLEQRHLMLRHLALAGKVVLIDEVHASDDYMNVYLDSVLSWLGHYRVPVIMLSATLTNERRESMARAYAPDCGNVPAIAEYPRITWVDADRTAASAVGVERSGPSADVSWSWLDESSLVEAVREALDGGGCALVIRNTVGDAQATADALAAANIAPVTLAHSRFVAADRAERDAALVHAYGQKHPEARPRRAIVVSTQVVEQSLDVDFDVLITDLPPMDLLFQRIGRLHRHAWRDRPPRVAQAQVFVLREDGSDLTQPGSRGSRHIYGAYRLLRTAAVLEAHGSKLALPDDIAPLVQRALGEEPLGVPEELAEALAEQRVLHRAEVQDKQQRAAEMCLKPWDPDELEATLGDWLTYAGDDPDEIRVGASVRDIKPSVEVLLVTCTPDGTAAIIPPWMEDGGGLLDTTSVPDDDTARRIATWSIRMPLSLSGDIDELIEVLRALPSGGWAWHDHPLLKGELILPMYQTDEGSMAVQTDLSLSARRVRLVYSPERGLEEVKDVQPD